MLLVPDLVGSFGWHCPHRGLTFIKRDHCTSLRAVQHPSMTPTRLLGLWGEQVRARESQRAANSNETETRLTFNV